jgi:ribonucleoside-diphosphate reductase alpha chain
MTSNNAEDTYEGEVGNRRRKMPNDRESITMHADVNGFDFYVTAGMFEDGSLGEVFIKGAGKEGSIVQGLLDAWAIAFSIALQYGAEFDMMARKFAHMKFEPNGDTNMPDLPMASSVIDIIVRWLGLHFGTDKLQSQLAQIAKEMANVD